MTGGTKRIDQFCAAKDIIRTKYYKCNFHRLIPCDGGHVFQATGTIFELIQYIIRTNLLTMFHEEWTINLTIRVLTNNHEDQTINVDSRVLIRQNAPPPGGHVFQATITIFKLVHDIIVTILLTKFHDDQTINVPSREKCPISCWPCFSTIWNIFELVQDINGKNLLTKFHEDQTINVASRVLTSQMLTPHDAGQTKSSP
ncbi:hypothetical protein DPMN_090338 [Dreissena polymorpha]|uniref:Uncharacterized protein n=1 Tax=Dreissena polymorpha TaxID=45954 RepID=A0A9D4KXJ2_DREPO|nr:hypothetical protein DPMN_090338 [Dreissena polymorpha]